MLALNFGVPKDVFDAFPKGETYIQAGPGAARVGSPRCALAQGVDAQVQPAAARQPGVRDFDGGIFRLANGG